MIKIYILQFTTWIFLFDCRRESSLDSPSPCSPVLLSFNGHVKLKLLISFGIKRCLALTSLIRSLWISKMLVMFSSPRLWYVVVLLLAYMFNFDILSHINSFYGNNVTFKQGCFFFNIYMFLGIDRTVPYFPHGISPVFPPGISQTTLEGKYIIWLIMRAKPVRFR